MLTDLRLAVRSLMKSPGFTAVATLTLALGIGGNTAIFAALHSVLLRQLPYPEPERLVLVRGTNERPGRVGADGPVSVTDLADVRRDARHLVSAGVFTDWNPIISGTGGDAERIHGLLIGDGFFETMRAVPLHGRLLRPEDQVRGHDRVVVLTHGLWQEKFHGDPAAIGRTIRLNAREHVIVGVLPPDFAPLSVGLSDAPARVYRPAAEAPTEDNRGSRYLNAIARLQRGAHFEAADAEVRGIGRRLSAAFPESNTGLGLRLQPLAEAVSGNLRKPLYLLNAAVLLVLLIACANVANLMLARAAGRRRNQAVCAALGASRARLIRATLAECLVLALLGGGAGLLLAAWGIGGLAAFGATIHPLLGQIELSWPVLALSAALLLLAMFGFGLLPAWQSSRSDLVDALKQGGNGGIGRGSRATAFVLVISEVALSLLLLIGSGLLLKSMARLQRVDPGFDYRQVLSMGVTLPFATYGTEEKQAAFYRELLPRLEAIPGVTAAAMVNPLPLSRNFDGRTLHLEGVDDRPANRPQADMYLVTPGYFAAMSIRLREGRLFTAADNTVEAPRVALVNETMARQLWPNENPLGKRFRTGSDSADEQGWRRVVGVVNDVRHYGLDRAAPPQFYLPQAQFLPWTAYSILLRTSGDPGAALAFARAALFSVDREVPLSNVATLEQLLAEKLALRRFALALLGLFAVVAATLAAIGIYGVVAYLTAQRRREFGIRAALGATAGGLSGLVLRQGLALGLPGLLLGGLAALGGTRVLRSQLFEVDPLDPAVLAGAALLLLALMLLACLLPARRAAKVDPMVVLRAE
jgi:putative ABC transport system permease protein